MSDSIWVRGMCAVEAVSAAITRPVHIARTLTEYKTTMQCNGVTETITYTNGHLICITDVFGIVIGWLRLKSSHHCSELHITPRNEILKVSDTEFKLHVTGDPLNNVHEERNYYGTIPVKAEEFFDLNLCTNIPLTLDELNRVFSLNVNPEYTYVVFCF